jgi:hypothetical protein
MIFGFLVISCFHLSSGDSINVISFFFLSTGYIISQGVLVSIIANVPFLSECLKEVVGAETYSLYVGNNPGGVNTQSVTTVVVSLLAVGAATDLVHKLTEPSIERITANKKKGMSDYVDICQKAGIIPDGAVLSEMAKARHVAAPSAFSTFTSSF